MEHENRSLPYGDPRALPGDHTPAHHTPEVSQGLADRIAERCGGTCELCQRRAFYIATSSSRDPNHVAGVCSTCFQTF